MKTGKMKNTIIKSLAILTVTVFAAAGCVKETFPLGGTLTSEQLDASENALSYMVNGIPAAMMTSGTAGYASNYGFHGDYGIAAIHLMTESMLEDLVVLGETGYFWFGAWLQNMSQGSDYIYCAYFWDCYYEWIKLTNDIIAKAGDVTEDSDSELKKAVGHAYAYRAMFYLDLARLYEPKQNNVVPVSDDILGLTVPIVTEATTEAIAKNNPRATRDEMYNFIFSDLDKAVEFLDAADNSYTAPSLAAVYGLYARAYLELGAADDQVDKQAYEQAAKYARLAITTSGKTPLTKAQWHDANTGFNSGNSNNSWMWGLTLSSENASNIITSVSHIASEATWGYSILSLPGASKAFYEQISNDDFRKKSWLDPEGTWNPNSANYTANHGYQFCGKDDSMSGYEQYHIYNANDYFLYFAPAYTNIKFRPAAGECVDYTTGNCADRALMRVEEMYFIEIEATLHSKGLSAAQRLLNEFMQTYRYESYDCSRNTGSNEAFIKEMLFQKRVEFWGEGILIYDYKRLNQGITRGYEGTNVPGSARFNCTGRSPQWNIVITRGEFQSNTGITPALNNPDPTESLELWNE